MRKVVLKKFTKFTRKHLCQSLFFIKKKVASVCNFVKKKRLWHRCFPKKVASACNFIEKRESGTAVFLWTLRISKNTFVTEHLRRLLLNWVKSVLLLFISKLENQNVKWYYYHWLVTLIITTSKTLWNESW